MKIEACSIFFIFIIWRGKKILFKLDYYFCFNMQALTLEHSSSPPPPTLLFMLYVCSVSGRRGRFRISSGSFTTQNSSLCFFYFIRIAITQCHRVRATCEICRSAVAPHSLGGDFVRRRFLMFGFYNKYQGKLVKCRTLHYATPVSRFNQY